MTVLPNWTDRSWTRSRRRMGALTGPRAEGIQG